MTFIIYLDKLHFTHTICYSKFDKQFQILNTRTDEQPRLHYKYYKLVYRLQNNQNNVILSVLRVIYAIGPNMSCLI